MTGMGDQHPDGQEGFVSAGESHDESHDPVLLLVTAVGDVLNRSSYPTPRTKEVLVDISNAYGAKIDAEVFPTLVFGVSRREGDLVVGQTGASFRFDQMAESQNVIQKLRKASIPARDGLTQLRKIIDEPPPLPAWLRVVGYVFMAIGFACCFRMDLAATAAAAALAAVISPILLWTSTRGVVASLMPVLLTFCSALVMAIAAVVGDANDPVRVAAVPVLILIPGGALTTSLIELTGGDMIAGASRFIYALVVLLSMAFGFALAVDLVQLHADSLQDLTANQTPAWVPWLGVLIFALGNVLYFCTPRALWHWVVVVTMASYSFSQLASVVVISEFAYGLAGGVGLLLALFINARSGGGPSALVLFLPSFWLLVPGSLSFVALSGVLTEDRSLSSLGSSAALSLLSMAISIMVASLVAPALIRRHE